MNKNAKLINNVLKLRKPQIESLEIFETLCNILDLKKEVSLEVELAKIKSIAKTFEDFDGRIFPSICFSLATGVGKTRLMGAFIAYLYYEKGIKNFFVMAPNLAIYNKLVIDFGNVSSPKYVFKGLDAFASAPRIINGDNYEEFRQQTLFDNNITINVFNISKLNAESKGTAGKPARIKRLNEVLGESYFDYLVNLPDLVLLMDESHHYRADRGMAVINELKPVLGIEVTATPQTQNGARKVPFKNVVYEYSLAHALEDGEYIKVPAVATRENFLAEQYTEEALDRIKLIDGVKIHIDTQAAIEKYARENGKKIIKPFVLVVAKDTNHSKDIYNQITSDTFFRGYYKDKVIEVNSSQTSSEKDENIEKLLSVEDPNNKIEMVIHVNMLKEGWDVNNLYTIIPLRASASETLTEQTIGRGLRLPYGTRTGDDKVDTLTIVSHDKFQAIIDLANDPNSLVRKIYYINPDDNEEQDRKNIVDLPFRVEEAIASYSFSEQLAIDIPDTIIETQEKKNEVVQFVSQTAYKTVMDMNKIVKKFDDIKKPEYQKMVVDAVTQKTVGAFPNIDIKNEIIKECIKKAVNQVTQLVTDIAIPIPQATVQQKLEVIEGFHEFVMDVKYINFQSSDETIKVKDLSREGRVSYINSNIKIDTANDTPENEIIMEIIQTRSDVDYEKNADLLYSLVEQIKNHFRTYLIEEDMIKVLRQRRKDIADIIYAQMSQHFYKEEIRFEAGEMRPFSRIEVGYGEKFDSDIVYNFRVTIAPSEVGKKIFEGFKRSCHSLYKFSSNTEKTFAIILEDDKSVQKWMCPNRNQFRLYWDKQSRRLYQPDFVVETNDCIYMIETKDNRMLKTEEVILKAKAGMEYCRAASEFNKRGGGKPWKYALISHDIVKDGMTLDWLAKNCVKIEM
jgi:type III restriction enzyme